MGWAAKTKQELSAGPATRESACTLGEGADGTGLGWVAVGGSAVGEMAAEGRAGSEAETKQQLSAGPTTREAARTLGEGADRAGLGWVRGRAVAVGGVAVGSCGVGAGVTEG